jgi:hypothetical protein
MTRIFVQRLPGVTWMRASPSHVGDRSRSRTVTVDAYAAVMLHRFEQGGPKDGRHWLAGQVYTPWPARRRPNSQPLWRPRQEANNKGNR